MSIRSESTANSQNAGKKFAPWQDRTADLGISALSNSHMCRYETHVITNYTKEALFFSFGPIRPLIFHRSPVAPAVAALAPSSVDPNIPVSSPSTDPNIPTTPPFPSYATKKTGHTFEHITQKSTLP